MILKACCNLWQHEAVNLLIERGIGEDEIKSIDSLLTEVIINIDGMFVSDTSLLIKFLELWIKVDESHILDAKEWIETIEEKLKLF